MTYLLWIVGAAIVLFLLDKALLKAEARGWIYYRRNEPKRSGLGNAFLEIQKIWEPSKEAMVEVMKEEKKEQSDSGDPPEPGRKTSEAP
jgi:hypothetical protein